MGKIEEAMRDFNRALEDDPRNEVACKGRRRLINDGGLATPSKKNESAKDQALKKFHEGEVAMNKGQHQDAAMIFSAAMQLDGTLTSAQANRGMCFVSLGRLQEALSDF